MPHLISMRELSVEDIKEIFKLAEKKKECPGILTTAFFEPSTRTKLSFHSAAYRLNMDVVDFVPEVSSLAKGESFSDTIRMLEKYGDVLVVRHPMEGSAKLASKLSNCPVINGGDGSNQHPTQTLIDLYTILKNKGKIESLKVVLFGDLKHARTMNSLIYGLAMFNAEITLISPPNLEARSDVIEEVKEKFGTKIEVKKEVDFENADVIYVTRVQEERFEDKYYAKKVREQFSLKIEDLENAKKDVIVMHPLPKLSEIPKELDESRYAVYFEEAANAVPIRMGVIRWVMEC